LGIVVVLDKRVITKRYGQLFLEALPECTVVRQRTDRLEELILRWMERDRSRRLKGFEKIKAIVGQSIQVFLLVRGNGL
jgi:hypothetical protein